MSSDASRDVHLSLDSECGTLTVGGRSRRVVALGVTASCAVPTRCARTGEGNFKTSPGAISMTVMSGVNFLISGEPKVMKSKV